MKLTGMRAMAICTIAALLGLSIFWLPSPLPVDSPPTSFSAGRAFEHIKQIAQSPHSMGTPEHERVREYLRGEMEKLGLKPQEVSGERRGMKIINLYGELEGTQPGNPPIILVSHYDTNRRAPGAADDTSGVATCLETIRSLKARGQMRNRIGVLITDGEESQLGLLGAEAYVNDQTNLLRDLRVVVNMEARGNHGPVLMFQTGRDNDHLIRFFSAACPLPVTASFSEEIYRRMPNDTDFTEFLKADKRGYNFAFVGGINYYHTPQDTPENLSQRTLQHYGECVLPLMAQLGQADDESLAGLLQSGDATFFPLCRGVLIHYPSWLARTCAFGTAVLIVIALVKGFWGSVLRARFVLASFGVSLLAGILAGAAASGAVYGLVKIYKPRIYVPFVVGLPFESGFLIGLLVLALVITVGLKRWLLKRARAAEGLAGGLVLFAILTLVANALLPGASYLFMWPALLGSVALLIARRSGETEPQTPLLQCLLVNVPAPLLFAPTIVLFFQAITIGSAPVCAALVALTVCLMPRVLCTPVPKTLQTDSQPQPDQSGQSVRK